MGSAPPFAIATHLAPEISGRGRVFCCHRATLSGGFPPNSLAAIQECVAAAVPRLEIDVRFLADDAMLVFHDSRLDPETTGSGPVAGLDRAGASLLRYQQEATPLCFLEDAVDLIRGSLTRLQIDLKLMRELSASRAAALASALAPVHDQVLIGSQAHWNLRPLARQGFSVALDPTLQWHYRPDRKGEGLNPARLGVHGLWDDAPIAAIPGVSALSYVESRVRDLLGLFPASEWMVDCGTILHLASLGVPLGDLLAESHVELAAWTIRDEGPATTGELLARLFASGVTTVITDHPVAVAGYAGVSAT